MSFSVMEARPPYVEFEDRSVEDRDASIKEGRLVMRPVHYAVIRQIGNKDTIEKEAGPWLDHLDVLVQAGSYRREWAEAFRKKYEAWKAGQEGPALGFTSKQWASVSKAQADNLINVGVTTVEDLASANEQTLQRVGMGARALQDKARAWLDSAKAHGNAEELAALRAKVGDLEQANKDLREKLERFLADDDSGKRKRA